MYEKKTIIGLGSVKFPPEDGKGIKQVCNWASTPENVPLDMCALRSTKSPAHSRSLIRIFTERILDSQVCKDFSCGQNTMWTLTRLRGCAVWFNSWLAEWSESSLGTFWIAKDVWFLHADNKDSGKTARMGAHVSRLISDVAVRLCRH